jgi:hypothetical protein
MALDDARHDRQPHAHAWHVAARVKALKQAEQFLGMRHVEAHAVVAHEVGALVDVEARLDVWDRLVA